MQGFKPIVVGSRRQWASDAHSCASPCSTCFWQCAHVFRALGLIQPSDCQCFTKNFFFWIKAQIFICYNHKLYPSQFMNIWLYQCNIIHLSIFFLLFEMHIEKTEVAVKYFLKICFGSSLKWRSINFAHRFYYGQETSIFRFTRELFSFAYDHFISYYGQYL